MARNDKVELEVRINEAQANIARAKNQDRDVGAYRAHQDEVSRESANRRAMVHGGLMNAGMQLASTAVGTFGAMMNPFATAAQGTAGAIRGAAGAVGTGIGAAISSIPGIGGGGQAIGALLKQIGEEIADAITAKFVATDQQARGMMGEGLDRLAAAGVSRETLQEIMKARAPYAYKAAQRQVDLQEDLAKFDMTPHGGTMDLAKITAETASRTKEKLKQMADTMAPSYAPAIKKALSMIG